MTFCHPEYSNSIICHLIFAMCCIFHPVLRPNAPTWGCRMLLLLLQVRFLVLQTPLNMLFECLHYVRPSNILQSIRGQTCHDKVVGLCSELIIMLYYNVYLGFDKTNFRLTWESNPGLSQESRLLYP